ncbi:hypothetical protein [Mycoplasmopsis columboralis]|uniref:Uncharacterized protein n=1 Tax=Mycoplasmopsis columboralis TaxID=171282 RepID=A0A449B683_9BACT|nr:hypothetical protein [Mycoplasmopsis columboralis]VEU76089.1 Uncharacterised protein [Mycoplasmopsis columboralis]
MQATGEAKEAAKTEFLKAMKDYYDFLNDPENTSLFNGMESVGSARPRAKFDYFMYKSERKDEETQEVIEKGFTPFDLANFYGQLVGSVSTLTQIKNTQKK